MTAVIMGQKEQLFLTEYEGMSLLSKYDLPFAKSALATSVEHASQLGNKIGYPVVLKGMSAQITHKTEAGIVKVDITGDTLAASAYQTILSNANAYNKEAKLDGVLVQKMACKGIEMIIGIKRDQIFGHCLVIGMGGTFVEILNDFAMRIMPVTKQDVVEMVAELKSKKLIEGYRGQPGISIDALVDISLKLNKAVEQHPNIVELDFNPVIFVNDEAIICDTRILLDELQSQHKEQRSLQHIHKFMKPKSIAIVGASTNIKKNGGRIVKYLIENGYDGDIYPINPTANEILGYKSYPSLLAVKGDIDVVCVIVSAKQVVEVLQQCKEKGIHNVIIYSSGFAEIGEEGKRLQQQILQIAAEGDIRIIGPNVIGVASPNDHVYMAFGSALDIPKKTKGSIAFISQSGAMGSALLSRAWENNIGFSRWITVANEADLTTADFIEYLVDDEQTKVISVFMEGLQNAKAFEKATKKALLKKKPVLVYKTGESEVGKLAVQSHTGSIAGDNEVYNAAFKKFNVLRTESVEDLVEMAVALERLPLPKGNQVGILTASGGACSIIADLCEKNGLQVPRLNETAEKIMEYIPPFGSAMNPVDVTAEIIGNPDLFRKVLETMVADEELDGILIMLTSNADPGATIIAQAIVDVAKSTNKPIIVGRLGANSIAQQAVQFYADNRFTVYSSPEKVVRAMKYLVAYQDILQKHC